MKEQTRILTSLLALLAVTGVKAQQAIPVPKLVVTVMIDQLRSDYLDAFSPLYLNDGFVRLLNEGRVYADAQYPVANIDRAAATATLYTGTVPYDHGVIGEQWLDRATLRPVYCVDDADYQGVNTDDTSSPKHLGVSTIGDELKVATEGKAVVYSIAPFRDAAILAAGHAADGAFWIDDKTGSWCGSSFYGNIPMWASAYSSRHPLSQFVPKMSYEPISEAVGTFNYFASGGMKTPFKHRFSVDHPYVDYKNSALVNEEVTRMVEACLNTSTIGYDMVTDFLAISYYAGNFNHESVNTSPIEMQDTYVRLDACIRDLLNAIDKRVGLENALIVLTSSGTSEEKPENLAQYRIPQGTFYINRTSALLNMYFMAQYGAGQYVDAVYGNQIYLNHKLLEDKQLNIVDAMERAQDFLLQCSGVKDVYTSQRLTLGAWTPGISRIRNGYNPKCSGDIFIEVAPGWELCNEDLQTMSQVRMSYVEFPIIFFGYKIENKKEFTSTSVDVIAPTLAHYMRIRAPNACSTRPLNDLRH